MRRIGLIGSASGWGAQIRGTRKGPVFMKNLQVEKKINAYWADMVHPSHYPFGKDTLPLIVPQLKELAKATEKVINNGDIPCIIGGDHVSGVGTFSGTIKALDAQEKYGLIWIDAHFDSHTPETSPSNAYHGMPVASLLGYGDQFLTNLYQHGPKIKPEHLVFIGVRSYEPEEEQLLSSLGVKIYYCDEVLKRGFKNVFKEAIDHVNQNTKAFGVSLDLDVFEPSYSPGIGSPEINGLIPDTVLPYLKYASNHPKFSTFELVEFNPELDRWNVTSKLMEDILISVFNL